MRPPARRALLILTALAGLGLVVTFILSSLSENIVFFKTPSEIRLSQTQPGEALRAGGLVKQGSVKRSDGQISFVITDLSHNLTVIYSGIPPDLFREGQGIVAEGRLLNDGTFEAYAIFAKHDETYKPPETGLNYPPLSAPPPEKPTQ